MLLLRLFRFMVSAALDMKARRLRKEDCSRFPPRQAFGKLRRPQITRCGLKRSSQRQTMKAGTDRRSNPAIHQGHLSDLAHSHSNATPSGSISANQADAASDFIVPQRLSHQRRGAYNRAWAALLNPNVVETSSGRKQIDYPARRFSPS
jgi:hypothetical protein